MNEAIPGIWIHWCADSDTELYVLRALAFAEGYDVKHLRGTERVVAVACDQDEWIALLRQVLTLAVCVELVQLAIVGGLLRTAGHTIDPKLAAVVEKSTAFLQKHGSLRELFLGSLESAVTHLDRLGLLDRVPECWLN